MWDPARPGAPGASRAAPAALVAALASAAGFACVPREACFLVLSPAVVSAIAFAVSCRARRATARRPRAGPLEATLAVAALVLAFLAWGAAARERDRSRALAPEPVCRGWIVGRVRGLPETGTGEARFRLAVERSSLRLVLGAVIAVRARGGPVPQDGARVAVFADVRGGAPATNPGGFDDARFQSVAGLAGRADAVGPSLRVLAPPAAGDLVARLVSPLRARLLAAVRAQEEGRAGAFLAGFLLGDRSALGSEAVDDLRRVGALHLLAISGMHVVLAAALLGQATRLSGLRGRRAALVRLVGVVGYAALAGGSASVWRAGVSSALVEAGAMLGRRVRGEQALALTVLLLTLARPAAPLDAGFQLSVLATWGLLAIAQPLQRVLLEALDARLGEERLVARLARAAARPALDALVPTLAAQLAALPVLASQFGAISALGLVSNLLLVPVTNLALVAGLVALAAVGVAPVAAGMVWPVADVCALATLRVADLLARAPAALRPLADPPWALAAVALAVATFGWPAARRFVATRAGVAPALCGIGIAGLVAILTPTERPQRGMFRWTLLDVGQGDAMLLEFPDGRRWLVDAGDATPGNDRGARVVLPALRARGVASLDALVVTHADRDHAGGAPAVLRDLTCPLVLAPGRLARTTLERARERGGTATPAARAHAVAAGETLLVAPQARVTALWPPHDFARGQDERWNTNRESVVLRIELVARDTLAILLTGDADTLVERELVLRGLAPATALKAGHHGSRTSSGVLLLGALAPAIALGSAGRVNRFGHPHPDVVARIRGNGVAWRSTSSEGALDFVAWTDGSGRWRWRVEPARGGDPPRTDDAHPAGGVRSASAPCQPGRLGGNVRRE